MAEWTGKWRASLPVKRKCECGIENGAESYTETFDAEDIDATQHEGETRECIIYFCDVCIAKYGKQRTIES